MTGLVCYIDLLGVSYLTGRLEKSESEPKISWYIKKLHKYIYEAIEGTDIKYSVLSDSVFLTTTAEFDDMFFAVSKIFRNCIYSGILLRAGLSYGEFKTIPTELNPRNLQGKAVTKACQLERMGKGCRIFIDKSISLESNICKQNEHIICQDRNYIDYSSFYVFEWPYFNENYFYKQNDIRLNHPTPELSQLIFENYKLSVYLKYSRLFDWNTKSPEGLCQLGATVEYVTTLIDRILEKTDIKHRELSRSDTIIKGSPRNKDIVTEMLEQGEDKYLKNISNPKYNLPKTISHRIVNKKGIVIYPTSKPMNNLPKVAKANNALINGKVPSYYELDKYTNPEQKNYFETIILKQFDKNHNIPIANNSVNNNKDMEILIPRQKQNIFSEHQEKNAFSPYYNENEFPNSCDEGVYEEEYDEAYKPVITSLFGRILAEKYQSARTVPLQESGRHHF
jgi:hypothetical protein